MSELDLLLIHPSLPKRVYQSLASDLAAKEPPLWAALLAEFTRRRGFSVSMLDPDLEGITADQVGRRVLEDRPRLVGMVVYGHQPSASTQNMPAAREIALAIKTLDPSIPILWIGGHAAALPERTLEEEPADFVCGGEGPYTLAALLEVLKAGALSYEQVPDLYYRRDLCRVPETSKGRFSEGEPSLKSSGEILRTAPAPLLKELDLEIPLPAWDLLPMHQYRAHNWHCFGGIPRSPYASIYTTLGCPYHCQFCCIQEPFRSGERASGYAPSGHSYRFWGPETVVRQIDFLVQTYGITNIKIADEMFVLNERHVSGVCDLLIERDYGLNLWAYARVDSIRDSMLDTLKRAGMNWLVLGIESANAGVRQGVDKDYAQEKIFQSVRKIREAGIAVLGNYIFGLPEDDASSMEETLRLAAELNTEFANFYCAMAYPGSRLYAEALGKGGELPGSWAGYSQHAAESKPLATRFLRSKEVVRFRDEAFRRYFERPEYLAMMENKFGKAVRPELEHMLSFSLSRTSNVRGAD